MDNLLVHLRQYRSDIIFFCVVLAAPMLFFFVGMPAPSLAKDSGQYYAYAVSLAQGQGFTMDGVHFSNFREPGYPYFIATIFQVFGVGNIFAIIFAQTLLLGLLGFFVYRTFTTIGERQIGYIAGLLTALIPSYGLYAHTIATETLFTFLLGAIFLSCVNIIVKYHGSWGWYGLLGLLCGWATLVRAQLVFFLPLLFLCAFLIPRLRSWHFVRRAAVAFGVFVILVGSWVLYVHQQTGTFAITFGRPEVSLYARAVHAEFSYAQLNYFTFAWVRRSATGGEGDPVLNDTALGVSWGKMATTTAATEAIKKWSIATIMANPGHYLYDTFTTQVIRLLYIEHDYSDFLNRYLRAGMYVILYGLFLFALIQMLRTRNSSEVKTFSALALLFILYNVLIVIPFVAIPRYNTPYLFLFLVVGFSGVVLYRHKHTSIT